MSRKTLKSSRCIRLKRRDYQTILDYYNIPYGHIKDIKTLKKKAIQLLNKKICSCIKKVKTRRRKKQFRSNDNGNELENNSIAICNYSVIQRKRLKLRSFECSKDEKGKMDLCLS